MTDTESPKLVLRNLIRAEWSDSNAGGVTPEFRTGFGPQSAAGLDTPLVSVGPDEESPLSPTGFTGIAGDGSGPTARVRGTTQVDTWAADHLVSQNPKTAAEQFADEIQRIVTEFYDVANYAGWPIDGVNPENYAYISYLGRTFLPDEPDESEGDLVYRYAVSVRHEYLDRP